MNALAGLLLRLGLDAPEVERHVRDAFVMAALSKARDGKRKATQSLVASLTGLSRVEVRRILNSKRRKATPSQLHITRLDRLLSGWRNDPKFIDRRGRPRRLEFTGARSSFSRLAKLYGRDVTPRVLLEQLTRLNLVTKQGNMLQLISVQTVDQTEAAIARVDLKFLAETLKGLDLQQGRRQHTFSRVVVRVSNRRIAQLVRRESIKRIASAMNAIGALSQEFGNESENRKARTRLVVNASITSETREKSE